MTIHKLLFIPVVCLIASLLSGCSSNTRAGIVAGVGWKDVKLGTSKEVVDAALGAPWGVHDRADSFFADYKSKGIQVKFSKPGNQAQTIFFFNKEKEHEDFTPFEQSTALAAGWNSTPEDVLRIYGTPKEDHTSDNGRKIVFEGIDFRFENGKMVRIAVFDG